MRDVLAYFFPSFFAEPLPVIPPFFENLRRQKRAPMGLGEGRTAWQLLHLDPFGVYVVRDETQRQYVRGLMRVIERPDIEVMTIAQAEYGHHLRGRAISDYDIDHYLLENTYSQMMGSAICKARQNLNIALKRG